MKNRLSIYSSLLKIPDRLTRKPASERAMTLAEGLLSIPASVYIDILGKPVKKDDEF